MSEENSEFKQETWLVWGRLNNSKKKAAIEFRQLTENGVSDERLVYDAKGLNPISGGVYTCLVNRTTDDCLARLSTLSFVRLYEDEEVRRQCELRSQVWKKGEQQRKLEEKYNYGYELPDNWDELRAMYKRLNFFEKSVFRGMLVAKLDKSYSGEYR